MSSMVGGIVIEVVTQEGRIFVDCRDRKRKDTCGVFIERNRESEQIDIGDSIWWQGHYVYWTPQSSERRKQYIDCDIKFKKLSRGGVTLCR